METQIQKNPAPTPRHPAWRWLGRIGRVLIIGLGKRFLARLLDWLV